MWLSLSAPSWHLQRVRFGGLGAEASACWPQEGPASPRDQFTLSLIFPRSPLLVSVLSCRPLPTDSCTWHTKASRPPVAVHWVNMQRSLTHILLLVICGLAVAPPCHVRATATDSLPRDGDVIILSGACPASLACCGPTSVVTASCAACAALPHDPAAATAAHTLNHLSAAWWCLFVRVCAADDDFDWATATGTWMIDIFAPWSVFCCC